MDENVSNTIIEMLGLTSSQTRLMYSMQRFLVLHDIDITDNDKKRKLKKEWLDEWSKTVNDYLVKNGANMMYSMIEDVQYGYKKAVENESNLTWYYISMLEIIEFIPYVPLDENAKKYKKCNYNAKACYAYIKDLLVKQEIVSEESIDRLNKVYCKSLNKISGKSKKIAIRALIVVATAAVTAAVAAVAAGPIAVAIFGSEAATLHGAALTTFCLSLAGGGPIVEGGLGIAGGIMIIAGGGAILGAAVGGTGVGVLSIVLSVPEFTLSQSAKLETVLKEIILNAQKDVVSAQKIIEALKKEIDDLNSRILDLEAKDEKTKKDLKNIKKSLEYLRKAYKDMHVYTSAFGEGLKKEA